MRRASRDAVAMATRFRAGAVEDRHEQTCASPPLRPVGTSRKSKCRVTLAPILTSLSHSVASDQCFTVPNTSRNTSRYEQTLNNSTRSTIRLGRVDRLIGMCTFVTYTNKRLSGAKRWPAVREVRLCGVADSNSVRIFSLPVGTRQTTRWRGVRREPVNSGRGLNRRFDQILQ